MCKKCGKNVEKMWKNVKKNINNSHKNKIKYEP